MKQGTTSRLARIETTIRPLRGCDDCVTLIDLIRFVTVDANGIEVDANRPTHCPSCGMHLGPEPPRIAEVRTHIPWQDI